MSLRVWLPLDGDLRNLGTSSDNFTINTTPVYVNNGKIGKAMSTGQITMSAQTAASILNNNSFSFTCWIYVNAATGDTTNSAMLFGNSGMTAPNNRKFSIFQYPSCNDLHLSWQNDVNSTTFTGGVWSGYFPSYQWTHLAITYQNPNGTIYINGIKKATFSGTSNSASFEFNTVLFQNCPNQGRYLNDYRIYDHCLSAAEVHEIAQGLVLHYKLDDITYGIEDSSGYNHNGEIFGDLITIADTKRYSYGTKWNCSDPTTNNTKGKCYIKAPLALSSPLQMSVSWWAKPENGYGGSTSHAAFCTSVKQRPTDYNSTAMHHRDAGFDLCPSSGSSIRLTFNQYTANQWHHYVITYDGQTARAYKDGTELASASMAAASTLKSFTDVWIGYSQAGGVQRKTLGTYSDFRVYCTALSAQDIKQLYELGMKIDNSHNLHAFEVVENNNKISLNNKRQFKCDEVVENERTKFFRSELVEAHQIIEC